MGAAASVSTGVAAKDVTFTAAQAYPESVTWSAQQNVFLVGSVRHGTVGKVTPDGRYQVFIEDARLISTLGLRVDDRRNMLWVAGADPGRGERTSAATRGKLAVVASFDATTGKPLGYYDLSQLHPGAHVANDLALDASGNVYVTDSFAPLIYKIDTHGHAEIFAQDPRFHTADGFNLNGIVVHPDGYLLVGNSNSGELFRVALDAPSRVELVRLASPLTGSDGLCLFDGKHLFVAQNGGVDRTVELVSTDGWHSASVAKTRKSRESMPTAVVRRGDRVYVLNAHLDTLLKPLTPQVDRYRLEQF